MNELLENILKRTVCNSRGGEPLVSFDEAARIARLPYSSNMDIFSLAGMGRGVWGPSFFTCAIINAKSGKCAENCAFCAQSIHHKTNIAVYPLVDEKIILQKALEAEKAGVKRFGIVTSGKTLAEKDLAPLCRAVEKITASSGLSICASLGMLNSSRARVYRECGISRYHHNLETAAGFFAAICSTHAYAEDIDTVLAAKDAGMEVCSGGIIGLGESWEQRVEFAFTLARLNVDSIPINFLNAIPGTKLENMPRLRAEEALRAIAIFRLVNPGRDILVAGGRSHVLGDLQSCLYAAGANGMMTGDYLTTSGPGFAADLRMMRSLGIAPD